MKFGDNIPYLKFSWSYCKLNEIIFCSNNPFFVSAIKDFASQSTVVQIFKFEVYLNKGKVTFYQRQAANEQSTKISNLDIECKHSYLNIKVACVVNIKLFFYGLILLYNLTIPIKQCKIP